MALQKELLEEVCGGFCWATVQYDLRVAGVDLFGWYLWNLRIS